MKYLILLIQITSLLYAMESSNALPSWKGLKISSVCQNLHTHSAPYTLQSPSSEELESFHELHKNSEVIWKSSNKKSEYTYAFDVINSKEPLITLIDINQLKNGLFNHSLRIFNKHHVQIQNISLSTTSAPLLRAPHVALYNAGTDKEPNILIAALLVHSFTSSLKLYNSAHNYSAQLPYRVTRMSWGLNDKLLVLSHNHELFAFTCVSQKVPGARIFNHAVTDFAVDAQNPHQIIALQNNKLMYYSCKENHPRPVLGEDFTTTFSEPLRLYFYNNMIKVCKMGFLNRIIEEKNYQLIKEEDTLQLKLL